MKNILTPMLVSFACVLASTDAAQADSIVIGSKPQLEGRSCKPVGQGCDGAYDCCTGICESCGMAEFFCRSKSCD